MSSSPISLLDTEGADVGAALDALKSAVRGADDGELFIERSESEHLMFDDGRLKAAAYDAGKGFGLRVVCGEATGYAHASEISNAAIDRAAEAAGAVKRSASDLIAASPLAANHKLYDFVNPLEGRPFSDKITLLQEIDAYLRAKDPRVVQVSASIWAERRDIEILRADGQTLSDVRPLVRLNISVTVEQNGRRESAGQGAGGRALLDAWMTPERWRLQADEALREALVNLDSIPCPAGEMDVVLGPGWPGVLLHEAIGHGLEGDFNRKGTSAFAERMGQRVAAPGVTIIDDGAIQGRRGSLNFDDEGTATQRNVLIEDGILVGYMHDRLSARMMGAAATGNGRRESFAHMPLPRMTNTFMEAGHDKLEDMIASTQRGLYAANFGGGQVDITSGKFVFQCTEAYLIEDGKVTAPVKGATLIGDGPSCLTRISMIGDDFAFDPGVGTCGKGGQGIPVGIGQPSLKIGGLTVGGAAV